MIPSNDQLRLHMGELTPEEVLIARAAYLLCASSKTPAITERVCEWLQDDAVHMPGTWGGSCGVKWTFTSDGPVENGLNYCPQCGGRAMLAAATNQPEMPDSCAAPAAPEVKP